MFSAPIGLLRSLFPGGLPANCFISHNYGDRENLDALLGGLPRRVSPFIFPRIDVTPEQRVSDDLVKAILNCPGLIYIESELTLGSFWCSFERDYAKRALKKVFRFDIASRRFLKERSPPRPLKVFALYSHNDEELAESVCDFLESRHFKVFSRFDQFGPGVNFQQRIDESREETLADDGGFVLAFISYTSQHRKNFPKQVGDIIRSHPKRILPVVLAPIAPDGYMIDMELAEASMSNRREDVERLSRKMKDDLAAIGMDFELAPTVLFKRGGGINWNRVDDLLVRIYDMAHRAERWRD